MKPIFRRRTNEEQKAQGIVEFALILPILLLVIFGIIEFGRMMFIYASVASASREAVRYGSAVDDVSGLPRYADCAGIRAAAQRIGKFAGMQDADIYIKYDDGITETIASCASITDYDDIELGDRVVVSVRADYAPMVMFANIPAFPITSTSARTIIKRVLIEGTPPPPPPPLPVCDLELSPVAIDGNTAEWSILNSADSDVIKNIQISFHSSQGNLERVDSRVEPDGFIPIWGDDVGEDPRESPVELITMDLPMPPDDQHIVISNGVVRDIKFVFTANSVVAAAGQYTLMFTFDNCGTLEH
ncbi:MAG: pilus assembly protein [Chloroflexi bacterium]|nr:pilus assembly protein [Chloroflexota bacterium]